MAGRTQKVGPYLPFQAPPRAAAANTVLFIDGPGGVTLQGQSVGFGIGVAQSTQGTVSVAGQSAILTLGAALSTQGAISVAGQSASFALNEAISTAGAIAVAGQSSTLGLGLAQGTQGTIDVSGQSGVTLDLPAAQKVGFVSRKVGPALPFKQTQRGHTSTAFGTPTLSIDNPGTVSIDGLSVALTLTSPVIGRVNRDFGPMFEFTQQTRGSTTAPAPITLPVEAGSVLQVGQNVSQTTSLALTNGAVTIAGQSVSFTRGLVPTAGAVTVNGETIELTVPSSLSIDTPGSVGVAGQSGIAYALSLPLEAGGFTVGGQSPPITFQVVFNAGTIAVGGQDLALTISAISVPPDGYLVGEVSFVAALDATVEVRPSR